MRHADAAGRLRPGGKGVPGGQMLALRIERPRAAPMRLQRHPARVAALPERAELRREIDLARARAPRTPARRGSPRGARPLHARAPRARRSSGTPRAPGRRHRRGRARCKGPTPPRARGAPSRCERNSAVSVPEPTMQLASFSIPTSRRSRAPPPAAREIPPPRVPAHRSSPDGSAAETRRLARSRTRASAPPPRSA